MPGQHVTFRHYGISPWEIEVIYDALTRSFAVVDEEREADDSRFVSMIELWLPMQFNEDFFRFLTFESWFKIKGVFKDIKRRRGRKGLKCFLRFSGFAARDQTALYFPLLAKNDRHFEMGIEKLEYLVDIVPLQLKGLPDDTEEIWYSYDESSLKWHPSHAKVRDLNYTFKNEAWLAR